MKPNHKTIFSFFIIGLVILFFVSGFKYHSEILKVSQNTNSQSLVAATGQLAQNNQNADYVPITTGLEGQFQAVDSGSGLIGIINFAFIWGIRVTIVLSVVFMVFGAVQYMTTDAMSGKKEGAERMKAAIGGLILALVSWLILSTINPEILKSNFLTDLSKLN